MNEALTWLLAGLAGGALGTFFYGGLWWTIRRGFASPQPALWFSGSLLARMIVTLACFYVVGHGQWLRLVLCLLGFVLARLLVMRVTKALGDPLSRMPPETSHAP